MTNHADVLDHTTNAAVVQLPSRAFPGSVVQGDTLVSLLSAVREAQRALSDGELEEAAYALRTVQDRLSLSLLVYIDCANRRGAKLPFDPERGELLVEKLREEEAQAKVLRAALSELRSLIGHFLRGELQVEDFLSSFNANLAPFDPLPDATRALTDEEVAQADQLVQLRRGWGDGDSHRADLLELLGEAARGW